MIPCQIVRPLSAQNPQQRLTMAWLILSGPLGGWYNCLSPVPRDQLLIKRRIKSSTVYYIEQWDFIYRATVQVRRLIRLQRIKRWPCPIFYLY